MKEILKKNKGITLIALVITVIILLILAGVAINLIMGQDGLLNKAKQATGKYQIESIKEKIELAISELSMNKMMEGKTLSLTDLAELQSEEIEVLGVGAFPVGVVSEGLEFEINEKFEVTYVGEAKGIKISYKITPEEYTTRKCSSCCNNRKSKRTRNSNNKYKWRKYNNM